MITHLKLKSLVKTDEDIKAKIKLVYSLSGIEFLTTVTVLANKDNFTK